MNCCFPSVLHWISTYIHDLWMLVHPTPLSIFGIVMGQGVGVSFWTRNLILNLKNTIHFRWVGGFTHGKKRAIDCYNSHWVSVSSSHFYGWTDRKFHSGSPNMSGNIEVNWPIPCFTMKNTKWFIILTHTPSTSYLTISKNYHYWLVVYLPLWNIWKSMGRMTLCHFAAAVPIGTRSHAWNQQHCTAHYVAQTLW